MNIKKGGGNCSQWPTALHTASHLADVLQVPVKTKKQVSASLRFLCVTTCATDNSKPL